MATIKKSEVVPSVQMPSADLINFRFDQTDRQFDELKNTLTKLTNNFVTREEAQALREERDGRIAEITRRLDSYRWYMRSIISAVLLALFTATASLLLHK